MWAIVPIKQFQFAKARLAPALDPGQRRDLMRAMAMDVLESLAATPGIERILVVSREPEVTALAAEVGASVLLEEEGGGLNGAVAQGAQLALEAGACGILVVHGDLPLATSAAFSAIIAAHCAAPAVTLVTDAEGQGSNCLACSPPDAIPFLFGRQSCPAHVAAARAKGIDAVVIRSPTLSLDVDSPADLEALLACEHGGRSVAFLRSSGIASRLALESVTTPAPVQVSRSIEGSA
ncbi:MAG: 2-phospho-L-lactate guanylyltransferase [Gammaproteobacteria bacterium]|nr:2-phospho-L-lactate guanylyltransferase [Gammaproteobacteria bacterium]